MWQSKSVSLNCVTYHMVTSTYFLGDEKIDSAILSRIFYHKPRSRGYQNRDEPFLSTILSHFLWFPFILCLCHKQSRQRHATEIAQLQWIDQERDRSNLRSASSFNSSLTKKSVKWTPLLVSFTESNSEWILGHEPWWWKQFFCAMS